ncbi:MAG: lytic transglycosylase domain-containing protein [Schwartzia sp.]|nr:lytic transglycosylase domain-containing protein [Schwartzia sp. (in: firmicutes)]MBR1759842.1 lytic transglycosylase domain-containing protein [Schwartzia sp. (in: firmicutes)]MBR1886529.1 lytic transglycosylase domain-containing protein [Schwartzia sp. (in: firmicutes)]
MDFSSVNAVMNRIQDIEYKVGIRRPSGGATSFRQNLANEMRARVQKPEAGGSAQASQPVQPTSAADAAKAPQAGAVSDAREMPMPPDSAYFDTIREAAGKYGVDPKLVSAVAEVESGFEQGAVSATGAVGVMQLMPETADSLGVNPYDATQNINGGAKYLRQMLDTFDGDLRKAVAAYNAGPEAVREYGGVPPYSETQQYVTSVLDLYR